MATTVDQKKRDVTRCEVVLAQIRRVASAVAMGGSIVETWRTYRGRRLGPYCRLAYRESGIQRSIYVGSDPQLVAAAREILAELQADERARRMVQRLQSATRASLRAAKTDWEGELARVGLHLQGFEVRGWRQGIKRSSTGLEERIATHERKRT